MNTRLQVEHPVTELITGVDLVEEMIRSAAGEPLRMTQSDVKLDGWAVESRVYAEDPARGFLPSTGRLVRYRPPAEGTFGGVTVRNDTGVFEGGEISIHYDPMIAKLVTHAADRLAAIEAQATALNSFVIEGIRHNIPFLSTLMQHPRWREGRLSTGSSRRNSRTVSVRCTPKARPNGGRGGRRPDGSCAEPAQAPHFGAVARARAAQLRHQAHRRARQDRSRSKWITEADGLSIVFADGHRAHVESDWRPVDLLWIGNVDGADVAVNTRPIPNGFHLEPAGVGVDARVYTRREAELAALMHENKGADGSKSLLCPMPGLVKWIAVKVGQEVKVGEQLCIVKAKKMENMLVSERDATVKAILAKEGNSLAVDAVIMEFA